MNTISYKNLKNYHLENEEAKENAKKYFGDKQPNIYRTGFYSAPSWNWGYQIGIVGTDGKWFEVVTQFGQVKSAREIYLPTLD